MAKRTIHRSDGSWEVYETRGFWYYTWRAILIIVIAAMAIQTWWLGFAIVVLGICTLVTWVLERRKK